MERYFKYGDDIAITLQKVKEDVLEMTIVSDYRFSPRKDVLYINNGGIDEIQNKLKERWKKTKTNKLKSVLFYFEEIDWYDNLVDIYETPVFFIKRGKKKVQVTHQSHGSIPKDWGAKLQFAFEPTKKITPLMNVLDTFFNANFNVQERKKIEKMFRKVLNDKTPFGVLSIGE